MPSRLRTPAALHGSNKCVPLLLRQARASDGVELAVAQQLLEKEARWNEKVAGGGRIVRIHGYTRIAAAFALIAEFANGGDLDSRIFGNQCARLLLSHAGTAGCADSPSS